MAGRRREDSSASAALLRRLRRVQRLERGKRLARLRVGEPGRLNSAVATISHEMREPLNAVLGLGRLLKDTPLDQEQGEYLDAILVSAESLVGLVNDILDLARIEAGGLIIQPVPLALRPFLERVEAVMAPRAQHRGLGFELKVARAVPEVVLGDPARLRQVLLNLLGNAVKFTERGHVRLSVEAGRREQRQAELRLTVADTGPGIAAEVLARLFRPFAQADAATGGLYGGSGLGLVIARRIVEAMGGRLQCDSTPAAGTRFTIELALALPVPAEGDAPAETAALAGARLLVVDPVDRSRETMASLAGAWGMVVRAVPGVAKAGVLLQEAADRCDPFDIILVDAGLPEGGAEKLAGMVAGHAALAGARLVLLASAGLRGDAARARATGFAAYLPKPATAATLLETLRRLRAPAGSDDQLLTVHHMREHRLPQLNVLVVDDNALNCRLLALLLERSGHQVASAGSGQEAIQRVSAERFDIVLMDVQMPGMGGLEAASRIRRLPVLANAAVPIVAVTANALPGDEARAMAAGMDGYLTKPIDGAALVACVERLGAPIRPNA